MERVQAECVDLRCHEQKCCPKRTIENPLNGDSDRNYDLQLNFTG